ncbi:MAG: zinc-binding alcohol dehydrogenase [Gemmatimonadetes bacterium]|jgi:threonine dehydrogenase-like Zn-dependent dehydrogenase|nr:zinc-binding alcohol dehydrogenase [Gemmatimonadota bacterium]MBT7859173.1 zinc-binding alcohol dehydrogenase [Gemmatimonadota bacterium]
MERIVACIDGSGRGILEKQEATAPEPGQVQVEVSASLISPGTELGRVAQMRQTPKPDAEARAFGYACAGKVIGVGDGVDEAMVGSRVACMGAGYAQHANIDNIPVNLTALVPEGVTDEQAAFAHLAATALHAIRRAAPVFGENAMVAGLGLVGQMSSQFAQASGGHAMGVDRLAMRVEVARACGVEVVVDASQDDPVEWAATASGGWGMDYGIIAFGGDATPAFEQMVSSLKLTPDGHRMGRIVIVGGAKIEHGFAAALGNVDVRSAARTGPGYHDEPWEHGADYPSVFVEWSTRRNLEECLRAIALGKLRVDPLITHRLPLTEIGQAVDELVERPNGALGVILKP